MNIYTELFIYFIWKSMYINKFPVIPEEKIPCVTTYNVKIFFPSLIFPFSLMSEEKVVKIHTRFIVTWDQEKYLLRFT